jgi:acyl-CoA dehydrogenase
MMNATLYDIPEHALLREQVARFISREVEPHAQAWEEQGMVPREVLQRMGRAGLLGLMYDSAYGGGEADARSRKRPPECNDVKRSSTCVE